MGKIDEQDAEYPLRERNQSNVSSSVRNYRWKLVGIGAIIGILLTLLIQFGINSEDSVKHESSQHLDPESALFFGDSYAAGIGASNLESRWTTDLARNLNIVEINAALPGEGYHRRPRGCATRECPYFLERLQQFSTVEPDIVILAGGQNDLLLIPNNISQLKVYINKTLDYLEKNYSKSQILVVGPTTPIELQEKAEVLDSLVSELSKSKNINFVSLRPLWPSLHLRLTEDNRHVDDVGHKIISEYIRQNLGMKR